MTNKNKELQGIIIEEILNQKGSRVSCDDCVIIAKKVTERFDPISTQPPKAEPVDVENLIEETYIKIKNDVDGCFLSADGSKKYLSRNIVQNILSQSPPKAEPVDVENTIKDLDCLNDYINSVHNKIPYVVKMNLYGLSNNIRCEVRNMLRISQSPHQTKE